MCEREIELAWAAGFLDGEGSFLFIIRSDDRGRGRLTVQASQSDIRPLEKLISILGGRIYGPYSHAIGKPYWEWRIGTEETVLATFDILLPYLSEPKQEQIAVALAQREAHLLVRPLKKTGPRKGTPWSAKRRAAYTKVDLQVPLRPGGRD